MRILICLAVALSLVACGGSGGTGTPGAETPTEGTGQLRLLLSDSPVDSADKLWVKFIRVEARRITDSGSEWVVLSRGEREFDLLTLLISNAGDVVSRDSILDALWPGVHVTPRTVDVHIAALRKKLENDPKTPSLIVGVRGVGYRLEDQTS